MVASRMPATGPSEAASASIVSIPRLEERRTLGGAQAGHEQHVAVRLHLEVARRAAPVELVAGIAPGDRAVVGEALGHDLLQPGAAQPIDGRDVVEAVHAGRPVAEQELDCVGAWHADALELLGVGRELEERGDARPTGELRVLHEVAAVWLPHDEVGEPDEALIGERGLEHDRRPSREGRDRGLDRGAHRAGVAHVGPLDLDDGGAQLGAIGLEHAVLVLVAHAAGALEHGVFGVGHGVDATELRVERAQERELALGRLLQVARARDDGAVDQVHSGSLPSSRSSP